jgi:tetratricopeptide (TPR) repeat protein
MSETAAKDAVTRAPSGERVAFMERLLFFVLLAVVCARPLISESFERLELSFLPRMTGGVTPATTVWLDSLTLIASAAVLVRNWRRQRGGGWVLVGLGALMLAVALSVPWAGEQRLALNAGFSLVIAALAGAALVQVMRAPWMPRVLLAATLASGAAMATKCALWKAYEHRDTVEAWAEYKSQLAAAGQDLSAPNVVNFERRLQSGEAIGYQSHPNVTGSFLTMWLLAAAGICAGWLAAGKTGMRVDRPAAILFSAALMLLLGFGLWYTHSIGAFVALAGGLVLLIALGSFRRRVALRPRRTVALLAAVYLALIAAGTTYGVVRGTLPHASLAFRWQYWTAGIQAFWDAPLTGVGRLNFADAYLRHKSAISPEEVRDPHNLWLSLLVELGPLGLIAGLILLSGSMMAVFRRLDGQVSEGSGQPAISVGQVLAAMVAVLLAHLLFSGRVEGWATAVLWAIEFGAVWLLSFVIIARLVDLLPDSDAARGWLLAGIAAALLAALIHGLIDFALLTPGGLYLFIGLLAVAIAFRPPAVAAAPQRRLKWLPAAAGLLLVFFHFIDVTLPTIRTEFWLRQLRLAAFGSAGPATYDAIRGLERQVLASDPLDADAAREVAGLGTFIGTKATDSPQERLRLLKQAEELAQLALERNPQSRAAEARLGKLYQDMEEAYLLAVRPDEAAEALHQAALHWQKAVELYPTDPRTRISAGKVWVEWWEESDDPAAARRAAEHFNAALEIDAARPAGEVMRLRPAEREEIDRYTRELPR